MKMAIDIAQNIALTVMCVAIIWLVHEVDLFVEDLKLLYTNDKTLAEAIDMICDGRLDEEDEELEDGK